MTTKTAAEAFLEKEIAKYIRYGYRTAYGFHSDFTLARAITFKFLATSEEAAREKAEKVFLKDQERKITVWNLEEELARLKTKK